MQFTGSGAPDFDELMHSSREEHVKLFFDTQQTAKIQKEAEAKIASVHTSLNRQGRLLHLCSKQPLEFSLCVQIGAD